MLAVWEDAELCWFASALKPPGSFSRTFFGNLLNLTWLYTEAYWNLLRNLFWNPVKRDLTLYQSLPDLHWNFLRFSVNFSGTLLKLRWLCAKASWNLLPNPIEPDLTWLLTEPRWTCTSAHRSYFGLKILLIYAIGEKHGVSRSGCRPNTNPI